MPDRDQPPSIVPALLTVRDVADILRTSERTVRRRVADRTLAVVRIGRSVRISPAVLRTFMDGGKPPSGAGPRNARE